MSTVGRSVNVVTDGLVLYMDAANPKSYVSGSTTWNDISINGNNGTLTNGPTYDSGNAGSIVFDGIDDYIQIQNTTNLPNWSYSCWYSTTIETNLLTNIFLRFSSIYKLYQQLGVFYGLNSITLDSNNNLFTGTFGNYQYRDSTSFCLQKINNDGTANDFNFPLTPGGAVSINNILIKSDDSVGYVAGTNIRTLSRFDTTTGTILSTAVGINTTLNNTVLFLDELNNHIYLVGEFTTVSGISYGRLARFDMDTLVVDSSFDTSVGFDLRPTDGQIDSIHGKIYLVGNFTTYKGTSSRGIVCLNYDGKIDITFIVGTGLNTLGDSLRVIIDSENKPIITGNFTSYNGTPKNRIVRLTDNGSIDTDFVIGTGFNANVTDMSYDSVNQKIYCIGSFSAYSGVTRNGIVRLNMDGSIDNTFSIGTGFNSAMTSITIQSDGKIIVGEGSINANRTYTRTYNSYQFSSLIRLNYDGSVDNTFNAGLGYTQGTYRTTLYIGYKNSLGVPATLSSIGTGPGGGSRLQLSFFQNYYNNRWHQFTITKGSDETYRVYNDGVLVGPLTVPVGSNTSLEMDRIWNRGNQSNALVYNRALSSSEVLQNYNTIKSRYGL